jgi:L-ribulokinase
MVSPAAKSLADIPGLCGIVPESVLPDQYGLEAGQSAVGDIFNWFVNVIRPAGPSTPSAAPSADAPASHESLTAAALKLRPGESGLLALDWNNGNRTILVDQRLTGLILGLTLYSSPPEIYRALIEATAFGARVIVDRLEQYGVPVSRVVNCGGIAARSPLAMQIYADVLNRPMAISRSTQTCALGSAIAAAVVAGPPAGGHPNFPSAIAAMTAVQDKIYTPIPTNAAAYQKLYSLYHTLHDAFGVKGTTAELSHVMKELLDLRDQVRANVE